jgi:hypothetical protein
MPVLTRWFLRSALIYLAAALLLGVVLALPGSIAPLPRVVSREGR